VYASWSYQTAIQLEVTGVAGPQTDGLRGPDRMHYMKMWPTATHRVVCYIGVSVCLSACLLVMTDWDAVCDVDSQSPRNCYQMGAQSPSGKGHF